MFRELILSRYILDIDFHFSSTCLLSALYLLPTCVFRTVGTHPVRDTRVGDKYNADLDEAQRQVEEKWILHI
jgi:hypothetical protein